MQSIIPILDALADRRLTVFLGAGATCAVAQNPDLTWGAFLRRLLSERVAAFPYRLETGAIDALLDSGEYLEAAENIQALYGGNQVHFRNDIRDIFAGVRATDRALIEPLARMRDLGATFITTNFDTIIDDSLGLHPFDHAHDQLGDYVLGKWPGLVHLHGEVHAPDRMILTKSAYEAALQAPRHMDLLRLIFAARVIVTIGVSDTLRDPTFDQILEWMSLAEAPSTPRVYSLLATNDLTPENAGALYDRGVKIIRYGDSHADLAPFLNQVLDQRFKHEQRERLSLAQQCWHRVSHLAGPPTEAVDLLPFLQGDRPTFSHAVHPSVPRRAGFFTDLTAQISARLEVPGSTSVFAFTGAAGEGKSTSLFQVANELSQRVEQAWLRTNPLAPVDAQATLDAFPADAPVLLVADEGASLLESFLPYLHARSKHGGATVLLLSAKTSDWRSVFPDEAVIRAKTDLKRITIEGVNENFAKEIVHVWKEAGLRQRVAGYDDAALASRLVELSRHAGFDRSRASLLSGLLQLLHASELPDRLAALLDGLETRYGVGGDVPRSLATIASFHAIGFEHFSARALAASLGVSRKDLEERVLPVLHDEASIHINEGLITRSMVIAEHLVAAWDKAHPAQTSRGLIYDAIVEAHRDWLANPATTGFGARATRNNMNRLFHRALEIMVKRHDMTDTAIEISEALMANDPSDDELGVDRLKLMSRANLHVEALNFINASNRLYTLRAAQNAIGYSLNKSGRPLDAAIIFMHALSDAAHTPFHRERYDFMNSVTFLADALMQLDLPANRALLTSPKRDELASAAIAITTKLSRLPDLSARDSETLSDKTMAITGRYKVRRTEYARALTAVYESLAPFRLSQEPLTGPFFDSLNKGPLTFESLRRL